MADGPERSAAEVTVERPTSRVAVVTYTNPAIRNHLSWEAAEAIAAGLAEAREGGAHVAVLASGHPEHWIQHAWLPDIIALATDAPQSGSGGGVFSAVKEITRPELITIAAIDGDTAGGGLELGWACDLRVAGAAARFAQIEVQLDLTTGLGGTSRLMRLIGITAVSAMVLDGRPVTAARMHELGAINRLVPAGTARDVAVMWATEIAGRSPDALRATKQILRESQDLSLHDALRNEQAIFQTVMPGALDRMREVQARFDAGESLREVYGDPNSD
ncbi:MAG: enoyl-CoA hydratase/isomerase family protein [Acidimicrobiales bacterium]